MRSRLRSLHPPGARADEEWPAPLEWLMTALPLVTGVGILAQRHALASPGRSTLFVAIAVFPWLVQLTGVTLPRPVFAAFVIGGTLGVMLRPVDIDLAPFPLVFLAAQMGALASPVEGALWTGAAIGLMAALDLWGPWDQAYPWYIGITLGWGGGIMVRSQFTLLAELRAAQEHLATQAATDERRRIARELHDVIAHSLTVMMLHVTGARRVLERDTRDAAVALEEAERLGRQSLQDVRRVVGVLGAGEGHEPAPMPGASEVTTLVEQFRGAGATIAADIRGDLRALEPTAGLALYRILQESLTNAAKHAPGMPVEVSIEVETDRTRARVTNVLLDAAAPKPVARSNGLGLWGMKERATLLGGSVSAGADDRSWIVEAIVPSTRPTT